MIELIIGEIRIDGWMDGWVSQVKFAILKTCGHSILAPDRTLLGPRLESILVLMFSDGLTRFFRLL